MTEELKPCPFCGGEAENKMISDRQGYGEYETTQHYWEVQCKSCNATGQHFHQCVLRDFTKHTVSEFRENPALRAKVEDEYDLYCKAISEKSIEAWNTRHGEK